MSTFTERTGFVILEVHGPAFSWNQFMTVWRGGPGRSAPLPDVPAVKWGCGDCFSVANEVSTYRYIRKDCEDHKVLIESAIRYELSASLPPLQPEPPKSKRKPKPKKTAATPPPTPKPPQVTEPVKPRTRVKGADGVTRWT